MDGTPIRDVQIQLQSATGAPLATVTSGVNGSFEFTEVPIGDYEVVATQGVNQVQERIHCDPGISPVTLRFSTSAERPGSGNTVSVNSLRVPEKARELFQKAQDSFHKNKLEDAWNHTEKALAIVPTYAQALTLRGLLRLNRGDKAGGEQDLQASIKNDSNYPLAYFAMGAVLNTDGRFDDAQRTLEQGLRIDPASWQGYFELSKAMMGKSDYRNALKAVVKAESLGAQYAPVHLVKAHALLGLKFYDEAATEFERYLQMDPASPKAAEARQSLNAARSFSSTAEK
jgi:tetratricopeptide (TPR) repeat protein